MSDTKHYLKLLLTNIHKKYSLKDTIDKNEYSFTMMKLSQKQHNSARGFNVLFRSRIVNSRPIE